MNSEGTTERPPLVVGLTGGVACGKSTVAGMLAKRGVPVIDADELARELVEPGCPALAEIAATFGADVLDTSGRLDRARLRARVFKEARDRQRIEDILHPRIVREMRRRLASVDGPYCVLCIPLLLETGLTYLVDRVLVVDAPKEIQIQRTRERDTTTAEAANAIVSSQVSRAQRLAAADDVIHNEQDLTSLSEQVAALHDSYLALAAGDLPRSGK